jgi:protein-disulfide isomerase-like protein with CxxC motif
LPLCCWCFSAGEWSSKVFAATDDEA